MRTKITDLFGVKYPIVLAPMGGASGGKLAAAVTNAGGLGLIGCGYGDPKAGYGSPEWISEQFDLAHGVRVGAGFITWSLARRPELLDLVLDRGADPIFLSFGDPAPFIPRIHAAGRRLILQVCSLAEAREARNLGADVVVAQGAEAGGHGTGERGLFSLLPAVVDAVSPTPVLAAGAVSDGRGLAAATVLGADGVLLGTRMLATQESLASPAAKARLVAGSGDDTIRTRVFDVARGLDWPVHFTGRALVNTFSRKWHGRDAELASRQDEERAIYEAARVAGDLDTAVLFAGEGLDLIPDCPSAAEVIASMVAEASRILPFGSRSP